MEDSTSREKVLKRVRDALIEKTEPPYPIIDQESPVFKEMTEPLDVNFAQELVKVSGKFVYSESEDEFTALLKQFILEKDWPVLFCFDPIVQKILKEAGIPFVSSREEFLESRIGITRCEFLIARLGSVMISSHQSPGRKINVFPDVHLVIGYTSQLVPDLKHALAAIRKKYSHNYPSMISFITGPSRTADIEKTLVLGAHGPRELYVFLIDDQNAHAS